MSRLEFDGLALHVSVKMMVMVRVMVGISKLLGSDTLARVPYMRFGKGTLQVFMRLIPKSIGSTGLQIRS